MELLSTLRRIRACEGEVAAQLLLEGFVAERVAEERRKWTGAREVVIGENRYSIVFLDDGNVAMVFAGPIMPKMED